MNGYNFERNGNVVYVLEKSIELARKKLDSPAVEIKFKSDKEFLIQTKSQPHFFRVTINNVTPTEITVTNYFEMAVEKINREDITRIIYPVTAVEMFQMWTNWKNSMRETSPVFDPVFADNLRLAIWNTLKQRSYVYYGSGKFEKYDLSKYAEIAVAATVKNNR